MNAPLGDPAKQQLPEPTMPPQCAAVVILQLSSVQSPSLVQSRSGSLLQTPFVQVAVVTIRQATASRLPQVDRAAQRTLPRTQRRLSEPDEARIWVLVAWATQRTYCP